ncbi:MAG: UvrD-helicase domain-containing protein [Candidatus Latescibacterota bacterium]|jgi:DNA helicase-2/ATP-dependent DNA helicase PcrA
MSILDQLNPAQREAVETVSGPLLVLAGAGSGKTRVLTYRIAHLLQDHGVDPRRILAVTFTKKAAGEMRERVDRLAGHAAGQVWTGTFHSVCARLLRMEARAFGLDGHFTIYDEDDRRALARRVLQAHRIDEEELTPRSLVAQISRAKNAMEDPGLLLEQAGELPERQRLAKLYAAYEAELRRSNAFDFDDLLVQIVRRFESCPEVLSRYQERFMHLLVDEYQDTNRPQYLLCRMLAGSHRNLCCVGDDDQSIYQFRGADIRNILDFERDYPDARVVRLEQNYRSTGRILAAANAVIQHNRNRKGKNLWTEAGEGAPIEVVACESDRVEARFVVETLRDLTRQQRYTPGDAAVLYRANAQSRALEEELRRSGMPYVIVGGIGFYERKEVKDLLAYLRLLANPADDASLRRALNVPRRGIGETSIERLSEFARRQGIGLLASCARLDEVTELGPRPRRSLEEFAALMMRLEAVRDSAPLAELGQTVYEGTGYLQMLEEEDTPEAEVRAENVDQLIAFMAEFADTEEEPSLELFLEEVALMTPSDEKHKSEQPITLMTLHSAKGLEFPVVFITGMEEDLFPTSRAVEEEFLDPQAIEEERRLCYVGITRARERLYLTYACRRYLFGGKVEADASRFLDEVPEELIHHQDAGDTRPVRPGPPGAGRVGASRGGSVSPKTTTPSGPAKGFRYEWDEPPAPQGPADFAQFVDQDDFLAVGQFVRHPSWGRGEIVAREGAGNGLRLTIRFDGNRVKKVAAAYAQLEPG